MYPDMLVVAAVEQFVQERPELHQVVETVEMELQPLLMEHPLQEPEVEVDHVLRGQRMELQELVVVEEVELQVQMHVIMQQLVRAVVEAQPNLQEVMVQAV